VHGTVEKREGCALSSGVEWGTFPNSRTTLDVARRQRTKRPRHLRGGQVSQVSIVESREPRLDSALFSHACESRQRVVSLGSRLADKRNPTRRLRANKANEINYLTGTAICTYEDGTMLVSRVVLLLFLAAQAFDGVFTYVAVGAYGLTAEGNALIATWIALVGPAPALLGAKLLAAAGGILLYVRGVHRTLAVLTMLYAVGAIAPWLFVLRTH
jgi:hypothetical protein